MWAVEDTDECREVLILPCPKGVMYFRRQWVIVCLFKLFSVGLKMMKRDIMSI
jgi:hypothetical protein